MKRIIMWIGIGIVLSALIFMLTITLGYFKAYRLDGTSHEIGFLGSTIFELTKHGEKYIGSANRSQMSFWGMVITILFTIVAEMLTTLRQTKKWERDDVKAPENNVGS